MLTTLLWFVCGLVALVYGAHVLVKGASSLAMMLGISPLVVGLTIVAIGTSSPEIAISIGAALSGNTEIAVGNVVGSNIFNVLFILGLSAVIAPLVVQVQLIRQEVPLMIGFTILCIILSLDGSLGIYDGLILVALLVFYTTFLIIQSRRQVSAAQNADAAAAAAAAETDLADGPAEPPHWFRSVLLVAAGLVLLVLGADWLVDSATAIAKAMGVSDVIIGLTIVAAGTSMPEVATSVIATLKGERDIAVGNVVGSNIFNILACLGIASLVAPGGMVIPHAILVFDFWVMLAVALVCLPIFFSGRKIARWEGFLLLGYYVAYTVYLILTAQDHHALPIYSRAMLLFVLPLTLLALLTSVWSVQKKESKPE